MELASSYLGVFEALVEVRSEARTFAVQNQIAVSNIDRFVRVGESNLKSLGKIASDAGDTTLTLAANDFASSWTKVQALAKNYLISGDASDAESFAESSKKLTSIVANAAANVVSELAGKAISGFSEALAGLEEEIGDRS